MAPTAMVPVLHNRQVKNRFTATGFSKKMSGRCICPPLAGDFFADRQKMGVGHGGAKEDIRPRTICSSNGEH